MQSLIIKSSHQGIEHNPIITILPIHKQNFLKFEIARVWPAIMFVMFKETSRKTLRNPPEICNQIQHIPGYCHSFLYLIINNGFEMVTYFKLISVLQFHPILVSWSELKLINNFIFGTLEILSVRVSQFNRFKLRKKSSSILHFLSWYI